MQNFFDGNQGAIVCIGSFYISDMKKKTTASRTAIVLAFVLIYSSFPIELLLFMMIRLTLHYGERPVKLFREYRTDHLMGKSHP